MLPDAPPLSTGQDEGWEGRELRRCRQQALAKNGSEKAAPLQTVKEHPHLSALIAELSRGYESAQPDDRHSLYVRAALSSEGPMHRSTAAKKKGGWQTRPRECISRYPTDLLNRLLLPKYDDVSGTQILIEISFFYTFPTGTQMKALCWQPTIHLTLHLYQPIVALANSCVVGNSDLWHLFASESNILCTGVWTANCIERS